MTGLLLQAVTAIPHGAAVTGIPALDGLIVSSPLAAALYLWVRSLQRERDRDAEAHADERRGWDAEKQAMLRRMVELAETQVELNTTLRERMTTVERHLGLHQAPPLHPNGGAR